MYSTSIQRRLFGETLAIIRAALHGEPTKAGDADAVLDLLPTAPGKASGTDPEGPAAIDHTADSATSGSTPSIAGALVPAGRATAAFFRSAAWDAPRAGSPDSASTDHASTGSVRANAPAAEPGSVPAANGPDGHRNVRAVLAAAAWDGARPSARVIPLDRESSQEAASKGDADAEAFQRAATETALAAARGGRGR
jgi:hypothetical protein